MSNNINHEGIPLFAAIKTFYENGSDILSAMSSLVLVTIVDTEGIEKIQTRFSDKYNMSIPNPVLQTVLKRLKRSSLIDYGPHFSKVIRTANGCKESEKLLTSVSDLNREFISLISKLEKFFELKKYPKLRDPNAQLLKFIDDNLGFASRVLTSGSRPSAENMSRIAEYILHVEKSDPETYVLLQNIFFGRLYLSMIRTRTEYSSNINMEPIDLFLDTSILMSLLGLHGKIDRESSNELIKVFHDASNIRVCIFTDTLDEARRLLTSAQNESISYNKNMGVGSIHHELKRQGYDRHRITLLIESLDEKVHKMGVSILDLPFEDHTSGYDDMKSNLRTWSELIEAPKMQKTLEHDVNVLYGIGILRNGTRSKLLEKSRAVFITPDRAVHQLTGEISKTNGYFPLSLQPLDIASMLWMRDIGNKTMATNVLRQSMMAYVREKAVSNKLWETFVTALKDAQNNDILSRDDVALILASDDVSILLAEKQFDAPNQIVDPKFVEGLRTEREELTSKATFGEKLLLNIEDKTHKISHRFAQSATVIVGLLCAALVLYGI